jgi:membrane protein implicated in regulation of membrane protease activity
MGLIARYAAFQIPGAIAAGLALWAAHAWAGLSARTALVLFALWVGKEFVLFPFLKSAYEVKPSERVGPERLLGARGAAEEDLDPVGYVRVRGELWRAEARDGAPIPRGAAVAVDGIRDLTLLVRPHDGSAE